MEYDTHLTRRRMLQLTGAGVLGSGALLANAAASPASAASGSVKVTVYDPTGTVAVTQSFAPRLDSLNGKTIAFISDDMWEDSRTFALIKRRMEETYPDITIITQDNFPHGTNAITAANNGIAEMMREKGVDGVIVGNAA